LENIRPGATVTWGIAVFLLVLYVVLVIFHRTVE
jgi:hypothetical protein